MTIKKTLMQIAISIVGNTLDNNESVPVTRPDLVVPVTPERTFLPPLRTKPKLSNSILTFVAITSISPLNFSTKKYKVRSYSLQKRSELDLLTSIQSSLMIMFYALSNHKIYK